MSVSVLTVTLHTQEALILCFLRLLLLIVLMIGGHLASGTQGLFLGITIAYLLARAMSVSVLLRCFFKPHVALVSQSAKVSDLSQNQFSYSINFRLETINLLLALKPECC